MCFYCRSLMHGHGVCPPVQNFDSEDDNSGKSDISSASEDKESNETLLNKKLHHLISNDNQRKTFSMNV